MEVLVFAVIWVVVLGGVGYWIAQQKRRSEVEGAALGCLLGPIGWIIEAVLPTGEPAPTATAPQSGRTSSSSSSSVDADKKAYVWQVLSVPGSLVLEAEDSRKPEGPDGLPPGWLKFDKKTSASNLIEAMAVAELHYSHDRGYRVTEAVWRPGIRPTILAAYGDPAKTYDLLWPDYPRVKWTSLVGQEGSSESGSAGEAVPPLMVPVRAGSSRSAKKEAADTESESVDAAASTTSSEERPTKACPDCAETILEAARICRFCRYEFWPAVPPPKPSSDAAEADEAASPPDDSSATDDAPDSDTQVTEDDAPLQFEPTTFEPEPPAPEPPPAPKAAAPEEQEGAPPPAVPPPGYATPPPPYTPPPPTPPPAGQPPPPPYAPQQPPYAPPPPGWQPPPPQDQGPWVPPPPRPPDWPRQ